LYELVVVRAERIIKVDGGMIGEAAHVAPIRIWPRFGRDGLDSLKSRFLQAA
jgi:hypothetical protein